MKNGEKLRKREQTRDILKFCALNWSGKVKMNIEKPVETTYYMCVRSKKVNVKKTVNVRKRMIRMGMSDLIAGFIKDALEEDGTAELQRSELANRFGCVPSQINYVISTRFSPERGYAVESRRGGGGYIRIRRVSADPKLLLMHTVNAIGDSVDMRSAAALLSNLVSSGLLPETAAKVMLAGIGDRALVTAPPQYRDGLRAGILKQMLVNLM